MLVGTISFAPMPSNGSVSWYSCFFSSSTFTYPTALTEVTVADWAKAEAEISAVSRAQKMALSVFIFFP